LFYIIFSRSVDFSSTRDSGDFRLISKWIADEIKEIKEHNLFLRGYIDWLGGKKTTVSYVRDPRFGGKPKYGFSQLYKLAMNGLVSLTDFFPTLLIRVLVISFFAVMSIFAWVSYNVIFNFEILVKGWSSVILTLMISLLIQLFGFTFITFYLKKILEQTSGLKNYQIKKD
jgi:dolichol-phosphate mannosyltransferase